MFGIQLSDCAVAKLDSKLEDSKLCRGAIMAMHGGTNANACRNSVYTVRYTAGMFRGSSLYTAAGPGLLSKLGLV